jgi:xanthine dehydrogenase FAD-binding subunit
MSIYNHYHLVYTIQDALKALSTASGPARFIAGGTDLLLDLQQGRYPPLETLVDVTAIPELTALEARGQEVFIGAAVTLNSIVASSLVRENALALVEACGLIGGPQVRNTATLGGNVGHALPAADGTIALLALDSRVEIANADGLRIASIESIFLGPGKSNLDPKGDLIVGFYVPAQQASQASAFRRIMRPQGVALPIINMAAWVQRQGKTIGEVRIAVGPGGPVPFRARETEEAVRGLPFIKETIEIAGLALLEEARFRDSPARSTAAYRRQLATVLLEETLSAAWERASSV